MPRRRRTVYGCPRARFRRRHIRITVFAMVTSGLWPIDSPPRAYASRHQRHQISILDREDTMRPAMQLAMQYAWIDPRAISSRTSLPKAR